MDRDTAIKIRSILVLISFIITCIIACLFLDYDNLSFYHNCWQYILLIIATFGCFAYLLNNKLRPNAKATFALFVWLLAIAYFLFIIISSIVCKRIDLMILLLSGLILASTSLTVYNNARNK